MTKADKLFKSRNLLNSNADLVLKVIQKSNIKVSVNFELFRTAFQICDTLFALGINACK